MYLKIEQKIIISIAVILCTTISCKKNSFKLKEGDILFQDLDEDSIDNAIEKVTKTALNYNFTHVGIVVKDHKKLKVLEAISTGVQLTAINTFLNRNLVKGKPKVVVGKLNSAFQHLIKPSITYGKTLVGLPYDKVYVIGDNSFYCAELLYEMFHKTDTTAKVFQLNPMTFKDPESNETLAFWKNYYKELNHKIPEGELGLNPNGMSVSSNITLVYDYFIEKKLN